MRFDGIIIHLLAFILGIQFIGIVAGTKSLCIYISEGYLFANRLGIIYFPFLKLPTCWPATQLRTAMSGMQHLFAYININNNLIFLRIIIYLSLYYIILIFPYILYIIILFIYLFLYIIFIY